MELATLALRTWAVWPRRTLLVVAGCVEGMEVATLTRDAGSAKVRRPLWASQLFPLPHPSPSRGPARCSLVPTSPPPRTQPSPPHPTSPTHSQQILYKVFEPSELKPLLDAVNADMSKEKEAKAGGSGGAGASS